MSRFSIPRATYIQLYLPENAVKVEENSGLAVAYTYTNAAGRPAATAFVGQQAKPAWSYFFPSEEQRTKQITKLFCSVRERKAAVSARHAERMAGHAFQPGDIVYTSWGYEQTNVDWYCVTRATRSYVWLKRLASVQTESGFMSGTCVPGQESTKPETRHFARSQYVNIDRHSGSKWDGRPKHYSTYG